jgi:hypothetical protein
MGRRVLRSLLSNFLLLLLAMPVFAQLDGNPANWCRQGFFPQESETYRIAHVTGTAKQKAYFYNDDRDDCPGGKGCASKSYVIAGDELIVSRNYGNWACSWYAPVKGAPTVGWIATDRLEFAAADGPAASWTGRWKYYDDSIDITRGARGALIVKGKAFWHGLGDNIHFGDLDHKATPAGNVLKLGEDEREEYACKATLRRVGRYLIASDNMNCGGVNVTFTGVYRKVK